MGKGRRQTGGALLEEAGLRAGGWSLRANPLLISRWGGKPATRGRSIGDSWVSCARARRLG